MKKIAIILGSKSDLDVLEAAKKYLEFFDLPHEIKILSAHRNHAELQDYIEKAAENGIVLIIACAGMAAHLPGVIAAMTHLPVIGVPLDASSLNGVDALYSIVQMPKGIPVATMAIGKAGVINAAVYAAKIFALSDENYVEKLKEFKKLGYKL